MLSTCIQKRKFKDAKELIQKSHLTILHRQRQRQTPEWCEQSHETKNKQDFGGHIFSALQCFLFKSTLSMISSTLRWAFICFLSQMQNTDISLALEILPCLLKKVEGYCQTVNLRYCETDLETLTLFTWKRKKKVSVLD